MATALHPSDSSSSTRSHKLLTQKKRPQGFEAPRNSLEFPPESYQGYHEIYENIPFSCIIKNPSKLTVNPSGVPVKKLIDEEMSSKVNHKRNAPSVVARLMGMDSLPPEASTSSNVRFNAVSKNREQNHGYSAPGSAQYKPFDLGPFGLQGDQHLLSKNVSAAATTISPRTEKPKRREHPQEEQLQKFKKEFETWQLNKKWEQNRNARLDRSPPGWREHPTFLKANLGEEKILSSVSRQRKISHEKASSFSDFDNRIQRVGFSRDVTNTQYYSSPVKPASENRKPSLNIRGFHVEEISGKMDESLPAANIVILKPNAEYIDDFRETWANSPEIVEKVGSIEHFLEEVKERLRLEVQGRHIHDGTQVNIEGPLRKGKRSDPKQIAQHIAKQIKESISKDIEIALMRSKSTRPNKNGDNCSLANPSDSICKETKKTFLQRLKNARSTVDDDGFSVGFNERRNAQMSAKKVISLIQESECSVVEDLGLNNTSNQLKRGSTPSFRLEHEKDATFSGQSSHLSRSYSAPASGTASAKLLLENQHTLSGVHNWKEHESDGSVSATMRNKQQDGFNFKNKVSYLRHNITLKHKLFNKKSPPKEQLVDCQLDCEEVAAAALPMNMGIVKDNSTEVPPSPVSISSSSPDDFFKRASPVSPLDIPFNKEHSSPQISEGIASNIPDQSSSHLIEDLASEVPSSYVRAYEEEIVETYSHEETYVQDVLVAAGLYQRDSSDVTSPRWGMLSQTVPSCVFEEVEKAYRNPNQLEECSTPEASVTQSHKMLFDLLNEALPNILKPRYTRTVFKLSRNMSKKIPQGKNLLDSVWSEMSNLAPWFAEPYLIENLVAHDINRNFWSVMAEEEKDALGDDIASTILEQLLDNFVLDSVYTEVTVIL